MVEAVLGGEGLAQVAELASRAAGAPVAIVVPRLAATVVAGSEPRRQDRSRSSGATSASSVRGRTAKVPASVVCRGADRDRRGPRRRRPAARAAPASRAPTPREFLYIAAVASLTEVASRRRARRSRRTCAARSSRTSARAPTSAPARSCAAPGGSAATCRAASSCSARSCTTDRPRHVVATISGDHPGALAQHMDAGTGGGPAASTRCCPPPAPTTRPRCTLERARTLAERLGRHGTVGLSSFYTDPAELRACDAGGRARARRAAPLGGRRRGPRRHRHRHLPAAVPRARLAPRGGARPSTRTPSRRSSATTTSTAPTSSATLEAYFEQNCNMNATAAAIYAHRHTVAYRLDRVKELTGLDPDAVRGSRASRAGAQGVPDHRAVAAALDAGAPGEGGPTATSRRARRRRPTWGRRRCRAGGG